MKGPTTKQIRKLVVRGDFLNEQHGVVGYHRQVLSDKIEAALAEIRDHECYCGGERCDCEAETIAEIKRVLT